MSTWRTSSSRASSTTPRSPCTWTTCAATTRTTSAKRCSRRSRGRCAWPPKPIRARREPCLRPKAPCKLKIAVVDYGMGNLRSVSKALEHVAPEAEVLVTAEPAAIRAAGRVVVPGQGAMPDCMRELGARGLAGPVLEAARDKPFLGICIGLQMLFERSDEGGVQGLGVLAGAVRRFAPELRDARTGARLKVPHMGWNEVAQTQRHALWRGIADASR